MSGIDRRERKTRTLTRVVTCVIIIGRAAAKATENNRLLTWQNSRMIELQQHTFDPERVLVNIFQHQNTVLNFGIHGVPISEISIARLPPHNVPSARHVGPSLPFNGEGFIA